MADEARREINGQNIFNGYQPSAFFKPDLGI